MKRDSCKNRDPSVLRVVFCGERAVNNELHLNFYIGKFPQVLTRSGKVISLSVQAEAECYWLRPDNKLGKPQVQAHTASVVAIEHLFGRFYNKLTTLSQDSGFRKIFELLWYIYLIEAQQHKPVL